MCTNPLLIRNRRYKDISVPFSNKYIKVPCGQCDECLAARANDIYVRVRYEADYVFKNGGNGFMCCLTYDDSTLPYFQFNNKKYMVFNKKHIIDFIKRLRINLDRSYRKQFNCDAPDFKYVVTSEFGSDPNCSHRPHYHFIFLFSNSVSESIFRTMFERSIYVVNKDSVKRIFGYIFQCDLLDIKRGGIRYSGKYILKDLAYESSKNIILQTIKFKKDYVDTLFGICSNPQTKRQEVRNSLIRKTKAYRKAIIRFVLPYRHMLQFYLISNDMGSSAIVRKYGEGVLNLPYLNFEGFSFRIPKIVKTRIEQTYGSEKLNVLTNKIFINYLDSVCKFLCSHDRLSYSKAQDILYFAKKYIVSFHGSLYLVNPEGLNLVSQDSKFSLVCYDVLLDDYNFFYDNNFFELRNSLYAVLNDYNSKEFVEFRASLAKQKREKQENNYKVRKLNSNKRYI